jgi:hypothetical protein
MRFLKFAVPPFRTDASLSFVTLWWFLAGMWVLASAGLGVFAIPALLRFNNSTQDSFSHGLVAPLTGLAVTYFVFCIICTITMPLAWPALWILNMVVVGHLHSRRFYAELMSQPAVGVPVYELHQHNTYYIVAGPTPPPVPPYPGAINTDAR